MPSLARKLLMLAVVVISASLTPTAFAQSGVAALNGPFAFLLKGELTTPGVPSRAVAAVGRFIADGQGNISGGMDYNSAAQGPQSVAIGGTYTLDSDSGLGTLTMTSTLGNRTFALYTAGGGSASYASGSLVETDGGPVVTSGNIYQQSAYAFEGPQVYGNWRLAMTGETLVTEGTPSPVLVAGTLFFPAKILWKLT